MALAIYQQDFTMADELYYTSRRFADNEASPVFHGFFGRKGGVSKGVYNALNCGPGSEDAKEAVTENLAIVGREIALPLAQILTLHQTHSADCLRVEEAWPVEKRPKADAHVTDKPGVALGILTADCAPVLFYGVKESGDPVVGAAHAGWKGAIGGVLEATLAQMEALGAVIERIRACIGPCIGQASYEVDQGFMQRFLEDDPENERFFTEARRADHFMFDLAGYCAARLGACGLENVVIKDLDTYFNEEDFFSYRRATHREEKDYGRQISLIYIKE